MGNFIFRFDFSAGIMDPSTTDAADFLAEEMSEQLRIGDGENSEENGGGTSWHFVRKRRPRPRPPFASPSFEFSHLFPSKVVIQDHRVPISSLNRAIVHKHFSPPPVTVERALALTRGRRRRTSSGGEVAFNTVFAQPPHLVRVSFQDGRGLRAERLVSPSAVPTVQCWYDRLKEEWLGMEVGQVFVVFDTGDHLDRATLLKQLPKEYFDEVKNMKDREFSWSRQMDPYFENGEYEKGL